MQTLQRCRALIRSVSLVLAVEMLALSCGCATGGTVVRKSRKQLQQMEDQAAVGRSHFFAGRYEESRTTLEPLTAEQHVSKPLYECELASVALLSGNKDVAETHLKEAIRLLENLYDEAGEQEALSIWGAESAKVYKGDPYERALVYGLYGMLLLESNRVEDALACFKRALLMDGDTEKQIYQSDFGLFQLLAAKCHDLLGEHEQRDVLLRAAADSFLSNPGVEEAMRQALRREYLVAQRTDVLATCGPSELLHRMVTWGGIEPVASRLGLQPEVRDWLAAHQSADRSLSFNTLLVGWRGRGPTMSRLGDYGEVRVIHSGEKGGDARQALSASTDVGELADAIPWLGNVSYQATTRGGRAMDNVNATAANYKTTLNVAAQILLGLGTVGLILAKESDDAKVQMIGLALIAAGLVFKIGAYCVIAESDIRCWQNLPYELTLFPMELADRSAKVNLTGWVYNQPLTNRVIEVTRPDEAPVTFMHVVPPQCLDGAFERAASCYNPSTVDRLRDYYLVSMQDVDADGDGEFGVPEIEHAERMICSRYDSDKNGVLDERERESLAQEARRALFGRMGWNDLPLND